VVVEDDVVRLGDIFEDAGQYSDRAVLNAPAPGRKLTLDARWLAEAARVYRVSWQPLSRFDRVVVERAGKTSGGSDVIEQLRPELEREGMPRNAEIEFSNRNFAIHLPLDVPTGMEVRNASYDAESGRFSALLQIGGDHPDAQRAMVTGRAYRAAPV